MINVVGFPQDIDAALHERATELSRTLAHAADLVAMYTEAHLLEGDAQRIIGLGARSVFEAVTDSTGLRRELVQADEYYAIVKETAR